MNHQRGIDTLKSARAGHQFFATAPLFSRRTQQFDAPGKIPSDPIQRQGCAKGRCGDDVVAAGMTDIWQRIVFRQNGDGWP